MGGVPLSDIQEFLSVAQPSVKMGIDDGGTVRQLPCQQFLGGIRRHVNKLSILFKVCEPQHLLS